jgi:hypothetical protein
VANEEAAFEVDKMAKSKSDWAELALASVSDEDGFEGEGGFMEKLVVPAD